MSSWFLIAVLAATLAAPQDAPDSAAMSQDPSGSAARLEDVVVEGRPAPVTIESARSFVDQIATRPFGALTLGRWETPVCPEIINLEGDKPAMILWRIRARAAQVGAPVAEGDCRPNVSIVLTADGSATATNFADVSPRSFRVSPGRTQRSRTELRQFEESDAPVRWWHISGLYDTHHRAFISTSGSRPGSVNADASVYYNQNRRQAFVSSLVIVDVSRLRSIDLNTLADYLAFVILAEVEPQPARASMPSILNVWDEEARVVALTPWDTGYLRGLYGADVRVSGSGAAVETGYQKAEIARSVLASAGTTSGE
jgi:hypothetical protein